MVYLSALLPTLSSFASQVTTAVVIGLGAVAVMNGELTTGGLAACTMLAGRSLQPLQTLVAWSNRLQSIILARQQVEEMLTIPQRRIQQLAEGASDTLAGALEMREVTLGYHVERPILSEANLSAAPGEFIAIIGENGGGKTSLAKALAGRLPPLAGEILLDGRPIQEAPASLLGQIGFAPQYGTLFSGTITQNLTMFHDERREFALQVASRLGLDHMVSRLPKGYNTIIGDSASETLPAGMIQRISIARVLTLRPKVLLFDEANMAIDSAGDTLLRTFLEELKGHSTILLISQRPSLLRLADRSYHLKGGRLLLLNSFQEAFSWGAPPPTAIPAAEATPAPAQPEAAAATGNPLEAPAPREGETEPKPWMRFLFQLPNLSPYLSCMGGFLEAANWKGTARQLAESLPHLYGSQDLTSVCNSMANLGYHHRAEPGLIQEVDARLMPFLFVGVDHQPLVAVSRPVPGSVEVYDPRLRKRRLLNEPLAGTVYLFFPPNLDAPKPPSWIRAQLGRFRSLIWLIMGVTLLGNVFATATPLFTMAVYDRIIPSGSAEMGLALMGGVLLSVTLDAILRLRRVRILSYIGAKTERILASSILERLLAMPASYTERVAVGVQVARIRTLEVIRDLFIGPLAYLYYDAPATLFFLIVLGIINPGVIFFMLLLIVALTVAGVVIMPILRHRTAHAAKLGGQRQSFLTEALGRIQIIQGSHAEDIWYQRYRELSGKSSLAGFQLNMMAAQLATLSQTMTMAASVGVMTMTAHEVVGGTLTTGAVVAAMILTWRIFAPIQTTFLGVSKMVQVFNSTAQIDRLMEIKGEMGVGAPLERSLRGEVSFFRVSFRYASDAEPALVGVTFKAPAGSVVAVIGANGSGKSSLLKMIMGLYTPQAGSVMIDNSDIRQIDALQLRQNISYVPQVCDIFFGTVAQNLRLVNPTASDADLEEATAQAGLLDEIRRLPEGFNTRLNESRSELLSTGFKQRISLARAYLKKAPVMLLDEPGNNLDSDSERLFQETVGRLRGNTTVFLVTHRPSHLQMADLVLYFDSGYLRAMGTPEEVKKQLPRGFV